MKTVVLYNGRTYKRLKDGMHGRAFPSNIAGKLCRQPGCLPYIYILVGKCLHLARKMVGQR
ncbi:hypothetical protein API480_69 [Paenibacillus phage vB_PlaP_API480]|nr:hypothetical protein API480_69 [Paenibacillus phage vB_PlaP_API480]